MKRKPWSIVILAILHVLAPLGNFILNAFNYGRDWPTQWFHWTQIVPKYLLFSYVGLPVLAGFFIYQCRRWSYWAYLACIALIAASNLFSFITYQSWSTFMAMAGLLLVDILVVAYFVVPSVQKIYFDPRLRWWEAAPRYHFDHEAQVNDSSVHVKNLAQGGLFFDAEGTFDEGDRLTVRWIYEGEAIAVSGLVVYKNQQSGYGVRFENLEGDTLKKLQKILRDLHAKNRIVKTRLPGTEDTFGAWLKRLVTKGEGLFPKIKT